MENTLKISNFSDMVQSFFEDCENEDALNECALYMIRDIIQLKDDAIIKMHKKKQNKRQ